MKIIKFYRLSQYGHSREFIHPDNAAEATLIHHLTGQKTVNPLIRQWLTDLCGITFEETIAPK